MNIQWMLFIYFFISTAAIIFNAVSAVTFNATDRKIKNNAARYERLIRSELQELQNGNQIHLAHIRKLQKDLVRRDNFLAYGEGIKAIEESDPEDLQRYLKMMNPLFRVIAVTYLKSTSVDAAFFLGFSTQYRIFTHYPPKGQLLELFFGALSSQSIFCRGKALEAICMLNNPGYIVRALKTLDNANNYQDGRIITESLSIYPGDRKDLNNLLWRIHNDFSTTMQTSILNYFRFTTGDMKEEFLSLLNAADTDREQCFCAIRYFGKYPDERAFPVILDYADETKHSEWEYSAIASTALGRYPGEKTVERLEANLHSRNWYVRYNSASALTKLHIGLEQLPDLVKSDDKFAHEIFQYCLDEEKLHSLQKEAAKS